MGHMLSLSKQVGDATVSNGLLSRSKHRRPEFQSLARGARGLGAVSVHRKWPLGLLAGHPAACARQNFMARLGSSPPTANEAYAMGNPVAVHGVSVHHPHHVRRRLCYSPRVSCGHLQHANARRDSRALDHSVVGGRCRIMASDRHMSTTSHFTSWFSCCCAVSSAIPSSSRLTRNTA